MIELFEWIERAVQTPGVAATLASWIGGALCAMSAVQLAKQERKRQGKQPIPNIQLRMLAFLAASHITFLIAYKLFNVEFDSAVTHGVLSGVLTPWVAAVLVSFAKARSPKLVEAARDPYDTNSFLP